MDKKEFFERFISLLENTKDRFELDNIHDALIVWFGENCLSIDPDDVKERIVVDRHAEGIDAILKDDNKYELLFIQAKTVNCFENTNSNFSENDLKSTLYGLRFILKSEYKGKITPELENLIDEYHEMDRTGDYKTKVLFLTLKKRPMDYKFIDSFKSEFQNIEIEVWDFDKIFDFYNNAYLVKIAPPPDKISFEVVSSITRKDSPFKSVVFIAKGKDLAKIYNDHKEKIFQQNVRYFLGIRSRNINRQILETAIDKDRSKNFWYFNNGITIICEEINEATSGKVINLKKAQIINGAQTTYALYESYVDGKLEEDVEVLIKAIETNDKIFIDNVTLYTNSQNAIRLRDLCSNDVIQTKIQKLLLDSFKYFYERKRGEFDSLYPTNEAKIKLLGKDFSARIISNEDAAQAFLAMFLDKPSQAKNEKGRIFLKDNAGFYDEIFSKNDSLLPEKILLAWKLLKYIVELKKEYNKVYKSAEYLTNDDEKKQIYRFDFLLHCEFFILNIFKDFLLEYKYNLNDRNDLINLISEIDTNGETIQTIYNIINEELAEYINDNLKLKPGYYHNKFFKNEKSIGLIRNEFNKTYNFVKIIE